jgi:hypothetical protein
MFTREIGSLGTCRASKKELLMTKKNTQLSRLNWVVDISRAQSAMEAMEIANFLDWKVELVDLYLEDGQKLDPFQGIARREEGKSETTIYAVVKRYTVIQNEDYAGAIDLFVRGAEATYTRAGERPGGVTAIQATQTQTYSIPGTDHIIQGVFIAVNSHNTSKSFGFELVPKLVNTNTYLQLLTSYEQKFKRKHTGDGPKHLPDGVQMTLHGFSVAMGNFVKTASYMNAVDLTPEQFGNSLKSVFTYSDNESELKKAKVEKYRSGVMNVFLTSPALERSRGSVWAGYLAVALYMDEQFAPPELYFDEAPEVRKAKRAAWEVLSKHYMEYK